MRHLPDQFAQVLRQPGSVSLSRLPSPERPLRTAMPRKECLRLDDDQSFTPIEEPGEQDHEGTCGSVRTSRPHLAFLKQRELFAKEQVLGHDGGMRGKEHADEQEQATFYKSLQDHLRVSEGRISFLRRTGVWGARMWSNSSLSSMSNMLSQGCSRSRDPALGAPGEICFRRQPSLA